MKLPFVWEECGRVFGRPISSSRVPGAMLVTERVACLAGPSRHEDIQLQLVSATSVSFTLDMARASFAKQCCRQSNVPPENAHTHSVILLDGRARP